MSAKEAGKRERSTELSSPVDRGQPHRQAEIATQTGSDSDGWVRPKRVCTASSQTDHKEIPTTNRYQLLEIDQPSHVDLELEAEVCSCKHATETNSLPHAIRSRPRRRKRKPTTVSEEPKAIPESCNQASPHDCEPWRPYSTCHFIPVRVQGLAVSIFN